MSGDEANPQSARLSRGATLLVGVIWLGLLLLGLLIVARYGSRYPFLDETLFIPIALGDSPCTLAWLWAQLNEHRVPVPKLVIAGLYAVTGCDARSVQFLNVICLAAAAAVLIRAARRLRGGTAYTDAVIPIILMQPGHYQTFLWGMTFSYALPALLLAVIFAVILRPSGRLTPRSATVAGLSLVLLALCGGNGIACVPAIAAWLAFAGRDARRVGASRAATIAWAWALAAMTVSALCFVGYERPRFSTTDAVPNSLVKDTTSTSLAFLSVSLGPAARPLAPFGGMIVAAALGILVLAAIREAWANRFGWRIQAAGVLAMLAAAASLALAVGWGRGRAGGGAEWILSIAAYATMAAPLLVAVYFAGEICTRPAIRDFAQMAMLVALASTLLYNLDQALGYGTDLRKRRQAMERDILDGVPLSMIIQRHSALIHPFHDVCAESMQAMHRRGVGAFAQLCFDAKFREINLPVAPVRVHEMDWQGSTARTRRSDSHLVFALPEPTQVAGVRIRFRHANDAGNSPRLRVSWRDSRKGDFNAAQTHLHFQLPTAPEEGTLVVWIHESIDELRIQPDKAACIFEVLEIVFLPGKPDAVPLQLKHERAMP